MEIARVRQIKVKSGMCADVCERDHALCSIICVLF